MQVSAQPATPEPTSILPQPAASPAHLRANISQAAPLAFHAILHATHAPGRLQVHVSHAPVLGISTLPTAVASLATLTTDTASLDCTA